MKHYPLLLLAFAAACLAPKNPPVADIITARHKLAFLRMQRAGDGLVESANVELRAAWAEYLEAVDDYYLILKTHAQTLDVRNARSVQLAESKRRLTAAIERVYEAATMIEKHAGDLRTGAREIPPKL